MTEVEVLIRIADALESLRSIALIFLAFYVIRAAFKD